MFRFENDAEFLIVYTGDSHAEPSDYHKFGEEWVARMRTKRDRFGVIIVHEPHEHHEDEDEDHHREQEAEISKMFNDFRHSYRDISAKSNWGYAAVYQPEFVEEYSKTVPDAWEKYQESTNRFSQYMFGIPGNIFIAIDDAKVWLREQANRDFSEISPFEPIPVSRTRVGFFYGSTTGVTEYAAFKIQDAWEAAGMEALVPVNIGHVKDASQLLAFDMLILGIPTWNIGQLQDDWLILFPQLDKLNFSGRRVALFGIGDQYNYAENFLDALGVLAIKLRERGAEIVGKWDIEGYEFAESLALEDGKFLGLGIDELNQSKLTDARVEAWVKKLIGEFALEAV